MFRRKGILCAISLLFVFVNTFAKRGISESGIPETADNVRRSEFGYFWHVTDVFFDPAYSPLAAPEHGCHMQENAVNLTRNCGFFGELGQCSAFGLMETIARAMNATARWKDATPDFCIFTGNLRCPNTRDGHDAIYETMSAFVTDIGNAGFPNIYPSYGWYDYQPHGHHPVRPSTLYERLQDLLHVEAGSSTLRQYAVSEIGYFSRIQPPHNRIRIIVINTNLYTRNHVASRLPDPAGQWGWLVSQLRGCRIAGQKAFILMSVPPGVDRRAHNRRSRSDDLLVWSDKHNRQYLKIINDHHDTIAAQFGGHRHEDTFRMVYNRQGKPVSAILLAPATTPRFDSNPAMRIYMYDKYTGKLIDFIQYFFNLTRANSEADMTKPEKYWEVGYSFRDYHRLPDVTENSLEKLVENFRNENSSFRRYRNIIEGFKERNYTCDYRCRLISLCEITSLDSGTFAECLSGEFAAHHRRLRESQISQETLRDRLIHRILHPASASISKASTSSGCLVAVLLYATASLRFLF